MVMLERFCFVMRFLHHTIITSSSPHHSSYDHVMTHARDQPANKLSIEVDTAPIDECEDGDNGAQLHAHEHADDDPTDLLLHIHHGQLQI
jgi:hypothetical protein